MQGPSIESLGVRTIATTVLQRIKDSSITPHGQIQKTEKVLGKTNMRRRLMQSEPYGSLRDVDSHTMIVIRQSEHAQLT